MELVGRQVIYFQAISQIAYTRTLLTVCTCNDYDLMATINQALSDVVHVHFDSTKVRYEEIWHEGYP